MDNVGFVVFGTLFRDLPGVVFQFAPPHPTNFSAALTGQQEQLKQLSIWPIQLFTTIPKRNNLVVAQRAVTFHSFGLRFNFGDRVLIGGYYFFSLAPVKERL